MSGLVELSLPITQGAGVTLHRNGLNSGVDFSEVEKHLVKVTAIVWCKASLSQDVVMTPIKTSRIMLAINSPVLRKIMTHEETVIVLPDTTAEVMQFLIDMMTSGKSSQCLGLDSISEAIGLCRRLQLPNDILQVLTGTGLDSDILFDTVTSEEGSNNNNSAMEPINNLEKCSSQEPQSDINNTRPLIAEEKMVESAVVTIANCEMQRVDKDERLRRILDYLDFEEEHVDDQSEKRIRNFNGDDLNGSDTEKLDGAIANDSPKHVFGQMVNAKDPETMNRQQRYRISDSPSSVQQQQQFMISPAVEARREGETTTAHQRPSSEHAKMAQDLNNEIDHSSAQNLHLPPPKRRRKQRLHEKKELTDPAEELDGGNLHGIDTISKNSKSDNSSGSEVDPSAILTGADPPSLAEVNSSNTAEQQAVPKQLATTMLSRKPVTQTKMSNSKKANVLLAKANVSGPDELMKVKCSFCDNVVRSELFGQHLESVHQLDVRAFCSKREPVVQNGLLTYVLLKDQCGDLKLKQAAAPKMRHRVEAALLEEDIEGCQPQNNETRPPVNYVKVKCPFCARILPCLGKAFDLILKTHLKSSHQLSDRLVSDFYDKRRPVIEAGLVTLVNDNPLAGKHKKLDGGGREKEKAQAQQQQQYKSAEQRNFARFYEFEPRLSKDPLGRRIMGEFEGKCFTCNADVDTFANALGHLQKLLKYFSYDLTVEGKAEGLACPLCLDKFQTSDAGMVHTLYHIEDLHGQTAKCEPCGVGFDAMHKYVEHLWSHKRMRERRARKLARCTCIQEAGFILQHRLLID